MNDRSAAIVITSIFEPTEAVRRFVSLTDYRVIVVGDKKSPEHWQCGEALFLDIAAQEALSFAIAKMLPHNHYGRKMIGYLQALGDGAQILIDTDDDNLPKEGWAFPEFDRIYDTTETNLGFLNMYKLFTSQHIWPRGFPLPLILNEAANCKDLVLTPRPCRVGIWQGLADGDPDVDAIYRLTYNEACYFNDREPVVLSEGTLCPFNSQNTAIRRELAPLLYLPAFVTFRFTDILRGLVAQCILWTAGYTLGFLGATVVQERNPHDYLRDFESEIPCYLDVESVVRITLASVSSGRSVSENLRSAYYGLHENGEIVKKEELELLDAWLADMERLGLA